MNERSKQLADQAWEYARERQNSPDEDDEDSYYRNFQEKFAELIIQECCSKLVEMGEGWHEFAKNPPPSQAHNASGALFAAFRFKEDAVGEIKEHFGIDE